MNTHMYIHQQVKDRYIQLDFTHRNSQFIEMPSVKEGFSINSLGQERHKGLYSAMKVGGYD